MMKWLPLWLVDKILLILAWFILGNTESYGLKRPSMGPLALKNTMGKTPVLDIGALKKIRSGHINVVPGIKRISCGQAELINGEKLDIDAIVLATGYRSNVPSWLQVRESSNSLGRFCCDQLAKCGQISWSCFGFMMRRKVNFSPRTDSQRHHFHMAGKETPDSMQLGSQGEGSPVHHQMPWELHKILARSGKKKLSNRKREPPLAIEDAFLSSKSSIQKPLYRTARIDFCYVSCKKIN